MNPRPTALAMKLLLFVFSFLLLSSLHLFKTTKTLAAENPIPPPVVPCDETRPDLFHLLQNQFHSLRPYQGSPCKEGVSEEALFCGNDLLIKDTRLASKSQAIKCEDIGGGKERCYFNTGPVTTRIAIDLSGAELPIAGNTELVKNSQNRDEKLDDAQKVNDYASWYLNGVINRAEYPFVGTKKEEDIRKLVDFSGPLNKLLPQEIQWISRSETVRKAGEERHGQIVGCTYGLNLVITQLIGVPAPCYEAGLITGLIEDRHYLSEWENHLPPLREGFQTFEQYWREVQHWRGKFCPLIKVPESIFGIPIPFIGGQEILLLCGLENPLSPNYYANLFPYIPYSSTEDREGSVEANAVSPQKTNGVNVYNVAFTNQDPAKLFFAHMEELNGLADLLQSTFVPKGEDKVGEAGVSGPAARNSCDITQIRTNAGDNLFAGEIQGDLSYTAEFSCDFDIPELGSRCTPEFGCGDDVNFDCVNGRCVEHGANTNPSCLKDIYVDLSLITKTPLVDEVYSRLVEGPASVFKRLFPKLGDEGSPLTHLLDIPAATKVNYSGDAVVKAGNPGSDRSGQSAELYFPHLGSVSEYFLKGIQTLLRPKGFGEPILSGQSKTGQLEDEEEPVSCKGTGSSGSYPELPKASGACKLSTAKAGNFKITLPSELVKIVEAAASAYKVPPSLIVASMYTEGNWSYKAQANQWTNENVKKWASGCAIMPSCNPDSYPNQLGGVIAFTQKSYWDTLGDAVKVVDPKREPNQCNLMDAIFAIAKNLATNHTGSPVFGGKSCFGIALNSGGGKQNSCSWNNSSVETAWKMQANGIDDICLTRSGSLITGDKAAACGPNFLDTCETLSSWSSSGGSSLNAGFWNLYQSLK